MRTILLILLIILSFNHANAQRITKKAYSVRLDSLKRANDSLILIKKTTYARFMSKNGNLIGYVDSYTDQMKEWAFVRYGINLELYIPETTLNAKLYMDSVIFSKYGKGIYRRIELETDSVFKNIPSGMSYDSTYFGYLVPFVPRYSCGHSKLYDDINRLLGIEQNTAFKKLDYDYSIKADFIINKDGSLSNPRILRSVNPAIETKLIQVLNKLPCKWIPARDTIGRPQKARFRISVFVLPDSIALK